MTDGGHARAADYPGRVILGIDTSLGTAVALIDSDGFVVAEADSTNPLGHAEVIGSLLEQVVDPTAQHDVTAVAAGMGPGPFTGLRVGIAAARTFALARAVPVVPVPSHDAAALRVLLGDAVAERDTERFAIVTDARRREFAYSVYEGIDDDGLPIRVSGPALTPQTDIDAVLARLGARRHDVTEIPASLVALCAARAIAAGRALTDDEPLYLRSPDVAAPKARA